MNRARLFWDQVRYGMRHPRLRLACYASGATLVLGIGVVAGYWWPAARAHASLQRDIATARQAVVAAMSAHEVKQAYEEAAKALPAIEQKLSRGREQSDVVDQLNRLARRRGIRIVSESYEEGKAKTAYVPLYLDLVLQGSYAEMRRFLTDVATLSAWGEIQEARVEGMREHPGAVKAHLRLVLYRPATSTKAG